MPDGEELTAGRSFWERRPKVGLRQRRGQRRILYVASIAVMVRSLIKTASDASPGSRGSPTGVADDLR